MGLKAEKLSTHKHLPKLLVLEDEVVKFNVSSEKSDRTTIEFSGQKGAGGGVIVQEPRPEYKPVDRWDRTLYERTDEERGLMVNRYVPYGESFEIYYHPKDEEEPVRYQVTGGVFHKAK